jgi:hypothetical protein
MSPIYSLIGKILAYEAEAGWYDSDSPENFVLVSTLEYFQPRSRPSLNQRFCPGCIACMRFIPMSTLWLSQFAFTGLLPH